jgi:hypothetical protein
MHCRIEPFLDQERLRCAPPLSGASRAALWLEAPLARARRNYQRRSHLLRWLIPAFLIIRRRPEPVESAIASPAAMACGHARLNPAECRRSCNYPGWRHASRPATGPMGLRTPL